MRNQFSTLADKIQSQAQAETEQAAKEKKKSFGITARTSGAMMTDKSVYFDDFARKQESPKKDLQ